MKMDYAPEIRFCYVNYQILESIASFAEIMIAKLEEYIGIFIFENVASTHIHQC